MSLFYSHLTRMVSYIASTRMVGSFYIKQSLSKLCCSIQNCCNIEVLFKTALPKKLKVFFIHSIAYQIILIKQSFHRLYCYSSQSSFKNEFVVYILQDVNGNIARKVSQLFGPPYTLLTIIQQSRSDGSCLCKVSSLCTQSHEHRCFQ